MPKPDVTGNEAASLDYSLPLMLEVDFALPFALPVAIPALPVTRTELSIEFLVIMVVMDPLGPAMKERPAGN